METATNALSIPAQDLSSSIDALPFNSILNGIIENEVETKNIEEAYNFESGKYNEENNKENIVENNIKEDNNIQQNIEIEVKPKEENSEIGLYDKENILEKKFLEVLEQSNILENIFKEIMDIPYATMNKFSGVRNNITHSALLLWFEFFVRELLTICQIHVLIFL